jgi:uncharacterized membrane protein YfcA
LDPYLVSLGFAVGFLVGMTSMGGAALMTPLLILTGNVPPMLAVGTDLVYGAITKIAGAWMHWRQGTVDLGTVRRLAAGSVPAGLLGAGLMSVLRARGFAGEVYLRHTLGGMLLLVAVILFARSFGARLPDAAATWIRAHQQSTVICWGAFVGFSVGLTSVGSGSLIAPLLLVLFPGTPSLVVGTDVFHAAVLVSATAALHSGTGNVNWNLIPWLVAGSVPGVLIGSCVAPRLPVATLRFGLGIVLFGTGLRLL